MDMCCTKWIRKLH